MSQDKPETLAEHRLYASIQLMMSKGLSDSEILTIVAAVTDQVVEEMQNGTR